MFGRIDSIASEVLCFHCGARNHVPEGWARLSGKCKECGTALFAPVKQSSTESESNHRSSTFSSSSWVGSFLFKMLVVLVVVGMLHLSFLEWKDNEERVIPTFEQLGAFSSTTGQYIENVLPQWVLEQKERYFPEAVPVPLKKFPPPVVQSPGVMWNKTERSLLAPFGIQTSVESDYYIKLVDAKTNRDAVAVYVVGGQDLEVLVPVGSYKMRYAYGKIWRGEQHLFGPGSLTRVEEALKSFDFLASVNGINGYTVELIPQIDGNLPTRIIARDEL